MKRPEAAACCRLRQEDLPRLMEIERRSFPHPWSALDFIGLLQDPQALCLGLLRAGKLIGYALGYCQGELFHLASLAVEPDHRRRGWGTRLLRLVLERARERGCCRCTLEVRATNRAALRLYEKAGFVPIEVRPAHYRRPPDDGIVMEMSMEKL
jgi:ribosomal-protein-alanine N-acetyltransferase